jgi:hypothetical protein
MKNIRNIMWLENSGPMNRIIQKANETYFNELTEEFLFSIDGMAKRALEDIPKTISWIKKTYPDLKCSPISRSISSKVVSGGLSVNHVLVNYYKHNIVKFMDGNECNLILEIGAGFGALARELMLVYPGVKYVILDLEEVIQFSHNFLKREFPDKKHKFLSSAKDLEDFDILYVRAEDEETHVLLKELAGYDLCVNTCSMGEIPPDVGDYYMEMVQNLGIKYFYWFNRFNHKVTTEGECIYRIPFKTNIVHFDPYPLILQCPFEIMKHHGQNCEIFMELNKEQQPTDHKFITLFKRLGSTGSKKDKDLFLAYCSQQNQSYIHFTLNSIKEGNNEKN